MCNSDIDYSLNAEIDILASEAVGHIISCPCPECDSERWKLRTGSHTIENIRNLLGCRLASLTGTLAEAYAIDFLEFVEPGWINPMQANARWLTIARIGNVIRAERSAESLRRNKPKR